MIRLSLQNTSCFNATLRSYLYWWKIYRWLFFLANNDGSISSAFKPLTLKRRNQQVTHVPDHQQFALNTTADSLNTTTIRVMFYNM